MQKTGGQFAGKTGFKPESSETICLRFIMDLDAQWIVGLVDGLGSFAVSINSCNQLEKTIFSLVLNKRDIQVLYALKRYFHCGVVKKRDEQTVVYEVSTLDHLLKEVVPFFEKHTLKTKKRIVFLKFRKILLSLTKGDHLTFEGMKQILQLKLQIDLLIS